MHRSDQEVRRDRGRQRDTYRDLGDGHRADECVGRSAHAAGEDTFTYGLLYQQEDELARRSLEQLDAALDVLRRSMRQGRKKQGGRAGL